MKEISEILQQSVSQESARLGDDMEGRCGA